MNVVIGAGPLGCEVARKIATEHVEVALVSRNPQTVTEIQGVTKIAGDVSKPQTVVDQIGGGAAVVYHCANAPYQHWERDLPAMWRGALEVARGLGARLVVATNVYAYGAVSHPMTENEPLLPNSRKGKVRAVLETEIIDSGRQGQLETAIVRGSDFYGPEVLSSVLGDRFFEPIIAGKQATFYGGLELPHSYTYLADFANTVVAAGTCDRADGCTWHAPNSPALSPKDMVAELSAILQRPVAAGRMPSTMLKAAGLFIPEAREMVEMLYEYKMPFIVSSEMTEHYLGVAATPISAGLRETVARFLARAAAKAA